MLLHTDFALETLVAYFTHVLWIGVIRSKWLHVTSLTLTNMLWTIGKVTKTTVTIRASVWLDSQMTVNVGLVLILRICWKYGEKNMNTLKFGKNVKIRQIFNSRFYDEITFRTKRLEQNSHVYPTPSSFFLWVSSCPARIWTNLMIRKWFFSGKR